MLLASLQKSDKVVDNKLVLFYPHPWSGEYAGQFFRLHIRVWGAYACARSKSKSYAIMETGINSEIKFSVYSRRYGSKNKSLSHACQIHSRRILIPSADSGVFPRSRVAMEPSFGSGGCKTE